MIKKIRDKKRILLVISLLVLLFFVFGLNHRVGVTQYTMFDQKIKGPFKVAFLADTHSCDFGKDDHEIIGKLEEMRPDIVLLGGDIVDDELPMEKGLALVKRIAKKYPSFYVTGNHEIWSGKHEYIKNRIAGFGVKVLSGEMETIKINNTTVNIMGIDDPDVGASIYDAEHEKLKQMPEEGIRLLLAHRPERVEDYRTLGVDYVFSGHAHGGQWRIPLILDNGLFAPNQGFFPKYTVGVHPLGAGKMIVSRGLSRESTRIPRFYNPPEIVMVNFTPASESKK